MLKGPILLRPHDVNEFSLHVERHLQESGREGSVAFHPLSPSQIQLDLAAREAIRSRWSRSLSELDWERAWGLRKDDQWIAHLELRGSRLASSGHRARLGMGVEAPERRKGLGRLLIETAIEWAKSQPQIEWIDLQVFDTNEPARAFYRNFGFQEIGKMSEAFKVNGTYIDNLSMALKIE